MIRHLRNIILSIMLIAPLAAMCIDVDTPRYGVRIRTYPSAATEFTSILLDDGKPIDTRNDDITLEMDVWALPENALGSICRIITDTGKNVDLLYGVGEENVRYPVFVTGDNDVMLKTPIVYQQWTRTSIKMSPATGKITFDYGGDVREIEYPEFKGTKSIRVAVGLCTLSDYLLFDVASVAVKDVYIYRDNKKIRYWKMERHNGDICYDEIDKAPARVENPGWIIDEALSWDNIYTADFPYFPSVAFDPIVATFYMAYKDDRKLYVYHSPEGATDTINTPGGEYAANFPNQMIFISPLHKLLSYNLNEDLFSSFNSGRQCWSNDRKSTVEHDYWNNTTVYNPADSSLISFGGYGHYHYKNVLLRSYPFSDREQNAVTLDEIHPRYSCSSVLVDSLLYIFGGRGCPTGRQELAPRNYYDLYTVNINTNKVTKLWGDNTSPVGGDFVPSENMVYDPERHCLYIWATLNGGTLLRADIATGKFEHMSLPAHANIDSQTLYTNLYYSPEQKSLYSVIVNSEISGESTVNIFRIDYPPIPVSSLAQYDITADSGSKYGWLPWVMGCVIIAAIAAGFFIVRRRRSVHAVPAPEQEIAAPAEAAPAADTAEPKPIKLKSVKTAPDSELHYDLSRGSVRFFGGFRVFDKNGEDITPQFTPTLKQLLILLVLYTGKNPMGIPNNKLLSLLWSDKEEEAAKNNRNVYMSRLRNLLTLIGDVTIQTHNGFRNICFGEGTVCDYLESLKLFDESDGENLDRLLELLFNGMMLPNVELDYVDSFKSDFSNKTLDLLSSLLKQEELPDSLKMKIADTLFQHDFINEDALRIKCRLLHKQGRTGVAQSVYASFCKEYRSLMDTDYPHSLIDIIESRT